MVMCDVVGSVYWVFCGVVCDLLLSVSIVFECCLRNYCAMLYGFFFVLCLCALSLHVIVRCVCDLWCGAGCNVCVILCGYFL